LIDYYYYYYFYFLNYNANVNFRNHHFDIFSQIVNEVEFQVLQFELYSVMMQELHADDDV